MRKALLMLLFAVPMLAQSKIAATYHNDPALAAEIIAAPACTENTGALNAHTWNCIVRTQITGEGKHILKLKALATFDDGGQATLSGTFERKDQDGKDLGPFRVGQVLERVGFYAFGRVDSHGKPRAVTAIHAEVEDIR